MLSTGLFGLFAIAAGQASTDQNTLGDGDVSTSVDVSARSLGVGGSSSYSPYPSGVPSSSGSYYIPYPSGGYPYPSGGYPYPSGGYPYPSGGYPYPSGGYPYPSGGYPSGGYPYPSGGWYPPTPGSWYPPTPGGYPGVCLCGSPCTTFYGSSGTCQANGQCVTTFVTPNCNGNSGVCTMDTKTCPNGRTVFRVPPSCNFAPCDDGSSGGSCRCGSTCFMSGGSVGVCQTNGECAQNIVSPNCNGNGNGNGQCSKCGDFCTSNGQFGFCGNNGVCRVGTTFPLCNGGSNSCTNDASCPSGQQCVTVGLYRTCQPRSSGQTCFSWPFSLNADTSASASSSSLTSASSFYPGSQCPFGQSCVNGVCQPSSCTGLSCFLPCCAAWQIYTQNIGICRQCAAF